MIAITGTKADFTPVSSMTADDTGISVVSISHFSGFCDA